MNLHAALRVRVFCILTKKGEVQKDSFYCLETVRKFVAEDEFLNNFELENYKKL